MESVDTPDLDSWEYDPDDLGIPRSSGHNFGRAAVATAAISSGNPSSLIQRVRISAISDLKEFSGKDMDEDRARAWIGKVKSAFQRDQPTEEEQCLTFGDLMVGSAKNWHRQLNRTTKTKWADLLESFQTQYCGLGMSVAWQYYHARKRSEETPLDYQYRLNLAALPAKLKIKDGNPKARREHVDHYIETLGDPEMADRLTLLRLADVDELEEVLRARERAKSRQRRSAFVSKFRQKTPASAPTAPARAASEGVSGSDGSDSEGDLRRISLAAAVEKLISTGGALQNPDPARSRTKASEGSRISDRRSPGNRDHPDRDRCSHCGSRKHADLDCWKRLTCETCGKGGHPTDRCLNGCWTSMRHHGRVLQPDPQMWVTRGERWVPTVTEGPGRIRYLVISNIGEEILRLDQRLDVGMILDQVKAPRSPGFVSLRSCRYREWQSLALESPVDTRSGPPELIESSAEPAVPRPSYPTSRWILRRPASDDIDRDRTLISTLESRPRAGMADATQIEAEPPDPERGCPSTPTPFPAADRYLGGVTEGGGISESMPDQATDRRDTNDIKTENLTDTKDIEPKTENQTQIQLDQVQIKLDPDEEPDAKLPICPTKGVEQRDLPAEGATATTPQDAEDDEEIYYHDSGDLSAEDLEGNLAVLPKIQISTTAKGSIEDLQVGDSGSTTPEEIERLPQIIWKKRHLLIGKGYALPPAAKGVVCDIDVGNAKPIALRTRKVPMRFREKVAGLIKGLVVAEIIRPSTSSWASPIGIVRKSNGVDIRLCIDYKFGKQPHEIGGLSYAPDQRSARRS
ncbi:hypothetical protein PHMEG_00026691 [Phytophthora megakarya]|uniref:CCHC-type domain-containing protein n=1 Tax=Phytophthora megakarya TaxID=4795 RepID=A0A225VBK4_9STRA|nr:hypothetical protein PHMEG_00026691 [Phytophthora megakarya]